MDKLRSIVQDKQRLKDPYWANLYETDIRSLFPKYELAKIQKAKSKYDKFRLMMENIEDFLFIQKHRKQTKRVCSEIDGILAEINELDQQGEIAYHIDIIKQRDNAELISQQLVKYCADLEVGKNTKSNKLAATLKQNEKWSTYIQDSIKKPKLLSSEELLNEKIHTSATVDIPNSCQVLNESTSSMILMKRLKETQMNIGLLQKWVNPQKQNGVIAQFAQEFKSGIESMNIDQYV